MRKALQRIAKWHGEFPETGRIGSDGEKVPYGLCYGSNGERDYMRTLAEDALDEK